MLGTPCLWGMLEPPVRGWELPTPTHLHPRVVGGMPPGGSHLLAHHLSAHASRIPVLALYLACPSSPSLLGSPVETYLTLRRSLEPTFPVKTVPFAFTEMDSSLPLPKLTALSLGIYFSRGS